MRKLVKVILISFSPDAHEVGEDPGENQTTVKAEELSLSQADIMEAGGEGLRPEAKILIPYDRDYNGQRELIYNGERWVVITSDPYKDWNGVVLRIRRKTGIGRSAEVSGNA